MQRKLHRLPLPPQAVWAPPSRSLAARGRLHRREGTRRHALVLRSFPLSLLQGSGSCCSQVRDKVFCLTLNAHMRFYLLPPCLSGSLFESSWSRAWSRVRLLNWLTLGSTWREKRWILQVPESAMTTLFILFKCSALWRQQLSCVRCKKSLCLVVYSFHRSNGTLTSDLTKFKSHKIVWRDLRGLWLLASCPVIFRLTSVLSNRNKTRHLQLQMKGSLVVSVLLTHMDLDVYEQPKNAFI